MLRLVDSHCHLHSTDYPEGKETVLERAWAAGVTKVICIGTGLEDSKLAVEFAAAHEGVFATIGAHPHDIDDQDTSGQQIKDIDQLASLNGPKTVAVGEVGLDYHYQPYDRQAQIRLFEQQLQLAKDLNLPVVFHVREAYDDFWPVVDGFSGLKGVLHSFSDNLDNLEKGLGRGFYVGLNGIVTYKKTPEQAEAFANVPLDRILLETDAPYLTPSAKRGIMNEPTYVGLILEWVAKHRERSLTEVADITTKNTEELFNLNAREQRLSGTADGSGLSGAAEYS
ncbi:MAG: TatD family hydrolase [Candidatus Nomurabacteria bacterium]|jgi:TatD DNase family protein|nr:TatD family hydrolase [Candidatus Nomurabacteria bacterium]